MSDDNKSKISPVRRLREGWAEEPIRVPGLFNALVARMAERLGYRAVYSRLRAFAPLGYYLGTKGNHTQARRASEGPVG